MNFETKQSNIETIAGREFLEQSAGHFLGEERGFIGEEKISNIITEIEKGIIELKKEIEGTDGKRVANYDRRAGEFAVGSEEKVSMGNIIASRHWGINIALPETLDESGIGKKIRKMAIEKKTSDILCENLNKELSEILTEKTKKEDLLKSEAYKKIAERSGKESKQLGIQAEHIITGVVEAISIDRQDLGITISQANAYQDVQNKIDFIIATKQKKRGVGVNKEDVTYEEKHIGVQFTINSSKVEHKADQINKAKERGVEVDDIIYLEIEKDTLKKAIRKWEESGKPISGPWKFLPKETREITIKKLFEGMLTEEQEKSLLKNL